MEASLEEVARLENALKKVSYDNSPVRIIKMEKYGDVLPKGENYLSVIQKVKALVMMGSGQLKWMSFIVKSRHESEFRKQFVINFGAFVKEIVIYRDILPKMQEMLENVGETDVPWPKYYDLKMYSELVFEDLGVYGYTMVGRLNQFGLQESLMVAKTLAKLHAASKIVMESGDVPGDLVMRSLFADQPEVGRKMIGESIKRFVMTVPAWGADWAEIAKKMEKASDSLIEKTLNASKNGPGTFCVLGHGDFWSNNILIKYDDETKTPESIKLLDFQGTSVTTPIKDLSFLLFSSVRPSVRKEHETLILDTYHKYLMKYLAKFNYKGEMMDRDAFHKMYREHAVISLIDCTFLIPVMLSDKEKVEDMEEVLQKESMEKEANPDSVGIFNPLQNLGEKAREIIKYSFTWAMEANLL